MFKMDDMEVYRCVEKFVNHGANYMRISYGTQIKIQEALLKFNNSTHLQEADLYDHLVEVCPEFVTWMGTP